MAFVINDITEDILNGVIKVEFPIATPCYLFIVLENSPDGRTAVPTKSFRSHVDYDLYCDLENIPDECKHTIDIEYDETMSTDTFYIYVDNTRFSIIARNYLDLGIVYERGIVYTEEGLKPVN